MYSSAATKDMPNMMAQTAVTMRADRMFRRASLRSMVTFYQMGGAVGRAGRRRESAHQIRESTTIAPNSSAR